MSYKHEFHWNSKRVRTLQIIVSFYNVRLWIIYIDAPQDRVSRNIKVDRQITPKSIWFAYHFICMLSPGIVHRKLSAIQINGVVVKAISVMEQGILCFSVVSPTFSQIAFSIISLCVIWNHWEISSHLWKNKSLKGHIKELSSAFARHIWSLTEFRKVGFLLNAYHFWFIIHKQMYILCWLTYVHLKHSVHVHILRGSKPT